MKLRNEVYEDACSNAHKYCLGPLMRFRKELHAPPARFRHIRPHTHTHTHRGHTHINPIETISIFVCMQVKDIFQHAIVDLHVRSRVRALLRINVFFFSRTRFFLCISLSTRADLELVSGQMRGNVWSSRLSKVDPRPELVDVGRGWPEIDQRQATLAGLAGARPEVGKCG